MNEKARVVHLHEVQPEGGAHALVALLRTPEDRVRRDTSLLLRPEQTGGGAITLGYTVVYPGCSTRGHAHSDREEIYVIVRGRGTVIVGDDTFEVGPDDAVYIPPGPSHTTRNPSPAPLEYYWMTVACPPSPPR
ncbi:MAG TPA: cupin domain-containing protein [bacterium]|nr:cupin domain-containing protein [bacterium]